MDVSEFKDKEFTDEEKHKIINAAVSSIYDQLRLNAKNICTYNDDLWGDNLLADTLMRFLKRDIDAKWNVFMQGKLERYLTAGMSLALRSSTSPFYSVYRAPNNKYRELLTGEAGYDYEYNTDDEERLIIKENATIVGETLSELHFYDRQLLTDYFYSEYTLKDIGTKYKINPQRIKRDINRALKRLKILLEDKLEW